ncbi:MAG: TRAP transporter TatT component family protein [Pseudomonadota bacterium]
MLQIRPKTFLIITVALTASCIFFGCSANKGRPPVAAGTGWNIEKLVESARKAALSALREQKRGRSRDFAEQGIELAERCLATAPEEPGCYYWRAVATGLYYRARVIGYQRGVKRMIEDCHKVIALDERYDNAGAWRILGQLYTQLPQTGGAADSITRDLDLAEESLKKAISIAPDYPENHIALTETLLAQEKFEESAKTLEAAMNLMPRWKRDASYNEWRTQMATLSKKIIKTYK